MREEKSIRMQRRKWMRKAKQTVLRRKYGVQWWKADRTIMRKQCNG